MNKHEKMFFNFNIHPIMENNEILKLLPKIKELKSVRLPSSINFSLEMKCLSVILSDATGNMQENKSAFEGWIICFRSWLPGEIDKVELEWTPSMDKKRSEHNSRFLFRVLQFQKMYCWFSVSKKNISEVLSFSHIIQRPDLVMNYPDSLKQSSISRNKIEDKIESLFVTDSQKLLKTRFNLETLNQQLPAGVFIEKKSAGTRLFTGQKSAIDLWGLNADELSIFELKYKNIRVGIISELLFYLYLMNAVFINGEIQYPERAKDAKIRDFEKLYDKKFKKLNGYFLIDNLHPFIGDNAIKLINDGLKNLGNISVQKLYYNYDPVIKSLSWR
jgi:hypothetical protein